MRLLTPIALLLGGCFMHHEAEIETVIKATPTCRGMAEAEVAHPTATGEGAEVKALQADVPDWRFWEMLQPAKTPKQEANASAWAVEELKDPSPDQQITDWFDAQARYLRVSARADGAPLGDLAGALSEALELNVVVDAELVDMPVSIALANATLDQFLDLLSSTYGIRTSFEAGVLHMSTEDGWIRRNFQATEAPMTELLMVVPSGTTDIAFAHAFCTAIASPDGSASALGDHVLLRDRQARIEKAKALAKQLTPADDQ